MSKVHKDDLELGMRVYEYTLKDIDGLYVLCRKEGEITSSEYNDKFILLENDRKIYFQYRNDYSIYIDEYYNGRVLLLSRDDVHALDLFLKNEYTKLDYLQEEINRHIDNISKIKRIING